MKHIVLIPALNEAESIKFVITGIQKTNVIDEIIVCDNGSSDNTIAIARSLGASVTQETKRGYGHTLMRGIEYISKKYTHHEDVIITFMDGDGADEPMELSYHSKMLEKNDIVFGSRTKLSKIHLKEYIHALANKFFGLLIFFLYGKWYTDLGPFRSMRLSIFLNLNIQDLGFGFTAEPQCTAIKQNLIIHEYSTNHRQRYGGKSKISGSPALKQIKIGCHIIGTIIKNRFNNPKIAENKLLFIASLILIAIIFGIFKYQNKPTTSKIPLGKMTEIFHIEDDQFIGNDDKTLRISGINLGQWLVREGYLWELGEHQGQEYENNYAEYVIEDMLTLVLKNSQLSIDKFFTKYQDNFITEKDIKYLSSLGVNLIRVPFSAQSFSESIIQKKAINSEFKYLDRTLNWCEQYNIYCLLDLHVATKAQNTLPHANSKGKANLWNDASAQKNTKNLWGIVAQRYKNKKWLAGFDLLNEPQAPSDKQLSNWYAETIFTIRKTGNAHTIFIQPNNISLDIESILQDDDNLVYLPHYYGFGEKSEKENKVLFDQKNKYSVAIAIGEVGNWANDWWAKYTDKYVIYKYFKQDIPIIYWTYKDMINNTQESFGIVSGNTKTIYRQFKEALEQGAPLPDDFPYDRLFENFKTIFPSDRPLVEQIIRDMNPNSTMSIPKFFDELLINPHSPLSEEQAEHETFQNYDNPYFESFQKCDGLTVKECFDWE